MEFPLGNHESKSITLTIAKKAGIQVVEKPDSKNICFFLKKEYLSFIKQELKRILEFKDINIVDMN